MVKSVHDGCATTRLGRTKRCRWPCICTGNAGAEREGRVLTKYAVGRYCKCGGYNHRVRRRWSSVNSI